MREIEVKLQFRDTGAQTIQDALPAVEWSEPYTQDDRIFLDKSMTEYKITPGTRVCRIRKETSPQGEEELSLTMKVEQEQKLASLEYETTINNELGMVAMLDQFGFEEFVAVSKTRRKARVKPYNLCLDEVKQLGTFLEVELLTDDAATDAAAAQSQMIDWAKAQGLDGFTVNMIPYDTQMYNLQQGQ